MPQLPGRPVLDQLRRRARAAEPGDARGNPVCARIRPPGVVWSAEHAP